MKIGIIGGGLSAVTFAHYLLNLDSKVEIEIFEKSKGLGGRMSTRTAFLDGKKIQFDHGARYFKARSFEFKTFLKPYIEQNKVLNWKPKLAILEQQRIIPKIDQMEFYVGSPKMNSFVKAVYSDLKVSFPDRIRLHCEKKINQITVNKTLSLKTQSEVFKDFQWIISSIPSHQVIDLLPEQFLYFEKIKKVWMKSCFSLMLTLKNLNYFKELFDAFFVRDSLIDWICLNHTKPKRGQDFSLVVQTIPTWSEENIHRDKDEIIQIILKELEVLLGKISQNILYKDLHFWRYAFVEKSLNFTYEDEFCLFDRKNRIICIGDWCADAKVEGAFKSGFEGARLLKEFLND